MTVSSGGGTVNVSTLGQVRESITGDHDPFPCRLHSTAALELNRHEAIAPTSLEIIKILEKLGNARIYIVHEWCKCREKDSGIWSKRRGGR
jgi:hypothetical protein